MSLVLSDDLLWSIFNLNTPQVPISYELYSPDHNTASPEWMHQDHLKTITSAAQVCKGWRVVLLSSPTIWAKLVDFSSLRGYSKPKDWLEILLERANGQPLYVYGEVSNTEGLDCLLEIIDKSWKNIALLHVEAYGWISNGETEHANAWDKIEQELSPCLFHFYLGITFGRPFADKRCILLNPQNPNVRYLAVEEACQFVHQVDAPLLHNLQVLVFNRIYIRGDSVYLNNPFPLSIQQLFSMLECAHRLEVLELSHHAVEIFDDVQPFKTGRRLNVPHLRYIKMSGHFNTIYAILLRINLEPRCGFDISFATSSQPSVSREDVATLLSILHDQLANKGIKLDSSLHVHIDPYSPSFSHSAQLYESCIRLEWQGRNITTYPFAKLLNTALDLSSLTTLRLSVHSKVDIGNELPSFLYPLIQKLTALKKLEVDISFFYPFMEKIASQSASSGAISVLPALEELILSRDSDRSGYGNTSDPTSPEEQNPLLSVFEFCKWRLHEGKFKRIHLGQFRILSDRDLLLSLLNPLEGLEVVLKDEGVEKVVVCGGSGESGVVER